MRRRLQVAAEDRLVAPEGVEAAADALVAGGERLGEGDELPLLDADRLLERLPRAPLRVARRTRRSAEQILREDSSAWASIQRGTEASRHKGVLSAREERVASFQRWLLERRAEHRAAQPDSA